MGLAKKVSVGSAVFTTLRQVHSEQDLKALCVLLHGEHPLPSLLLYSVFGMYHYGYILFLKFLQLCGLGTPSATLLSVDVFHYYVWSRWVGTEQSALNTFWLSGITSFSRHVFHTIYTFLK